MKIEPEKFEIMCRKEFGRIESQPFIDAIEKCPDNEFINVEFIQWQKTKSIELPKEDVEIYAKIAKESRIPEDKLISQIKPQLRDWILQNRIKVKQKILDSMQLSSNKNAKEEGLTIIWPIDAPDKISYDVAIEYVKYY